MKSLSQVILLISLIALQIIITNAELKRKIFLKDQSSVFWEEGGTFPTNNRDVDIIIVKTQMLYDLSRVFSFTDWKGWSNTAIVANFEGTTCPDIFTDVSEDGNSITIKICNGMSDLIGHSWGLGLVTGLSTIHPKTTALGQTLAMMVSYADIFDAVLTLAFDFDNNTYYCKQPVTCPVSVATRKPSQCFVGQNTPDSSVRWLIGNFEVQGGTIRDIWNPVCAGTKQKGAPFTQSYVCPKSRSGTECIEFYQRSSTILSSAFSSLVDGGSFQSRTITGIGLTKAFHIFVRSLKLYDRPDTTFIQHADNLEKACSDLIGQPLAELTTNVPDNETITTSDCDQVKNSIFVVGMRAAIPCKDPDLCGAFTQKELTIILVPSIVGGAAFIFIVVVIILYATGKIKNPYYIVKDCITCKSCRDKK